MAGLQRSALSFRRQGSSGLVWDDKFLSQLNKLHQQHLEKDAEILIRSTKSDGGPSPDRMKVAEEDPPTSPRVYACCFCGVFGGSRKGDKSGKSK